MLKNDGVFLKRPLQCEEYQPFDKREKNIDFLYDGSVSIEGQIYPYDQYCVSYVEDFNGNEVRIIILKNIKVFRLKAALNLNF